MRLLTIAAVAGAVLLSGCVANSIRSDYHGPLAHITDSVTPRDDKSADFFYVAKVDGFVVADSLEATEGANRGAGKDKKFVVIGRDVAAAATTVTLVGITHYAAALQAFGGPAYQLSGDISFTPEPKHEYVVRGVLGEDYSAVWIEDSGTGEVAGPKIEVKGAAPLGLFEKLGLP